MPYGFAPRSLVRDARSQNQASGLIGSLLCSGLNRDLPRPVVARSAFAGGLAMIAVVAANGLMTSDPRAWQGGGLRVSQLERVRKGV